MHIPYMDLYLLDILHSLNIAHTWELKFSKHMAAVKVVLTAFRYASNADPPAAAYK